MSITRRELLHRIGHAGGFSAAYLAMQALGLLPAALAYSGPPRLPAGSGAGISVVILGAGLAGMTACHELRKAGYTCTVLEARRRVGGRTWTIRGGDEVDELGGARQVCEFDAGLYFNPGPARIPSQHRALLGYCKELEVPLEVFVSSNRSALFQDDAAFDGRPVEARQVHHDSAGHIAELLAKAIDRRALDETLGAIDKERLLEFVRNFGDLDASFRYRGSPRSGYAVMPGAGFEAGHIRASLGLEGLLGARFWRWPMYFESMFEQQVSMLQPVGGMDRIATAFEASIESSLRREAVVLEIRKKPDGVRIIYRDEEARAERSLEADYCICTLPPPVLRETPSDLSPAVKIALRLSGTSPACKLAFEAKRRFWEDHGIYGGISWTEKEITQVWYPSSGFHSAKGVLIGAYNFDRQAIVFGERTPLERAAIALEEGASLHPEMREHVHKPISVAWHRVPFSRGAYTLWPSAMLEEIYPTLAVPDDRIYLAGEHVSHWSSWQEGAVLSAQNVVRALHTRVQAGRS
jgi:monoamine oxidase